MDFLKHGFRVLGMLVLLIILRNVGVYKLSLVFASGMPNNAFYLKTLLVRFLVLDCFLVFDVCWWLWGFKIVGIFVFWV